MQYYTYPQAIDEFERRLLTAVNNFFQNPTNNSPYAVQYALFVDTDQAVRPPRMRSEFVWEIMGSGICQASVKDLISLKHWINWWRQRWQRAPNAPDFTGMGECTRRGLVVQLAQLATREPDEGQTQRMDKLGATIRVLHHQGALRWTELADLSDCLLSTSCLAQASNLTPAPAFAVNGIKWAFIWHAIAHAQPEHHDLFKHFNTISTSMQDFCSSIDDFLAGKTSTNAEELPDNLVA